MLVYSDNLVERGQQLYSYGVSFNPPDQSQILKAMVWCRNRFGPDGISRTNELSLFAVDPRRWTCIDRVFRFNDLIEATVFKLRWGLEKEEPHRRRIL